MAVKSFGRTSNKKNVMNHRDALSEVLQTENKWTAKVWSDHNN